MYYLSANVLCLGYVIRCDSLHKSAYNPAILGADVRVL